MTLKNIFKRTVFKKFIGIVLAVCIIAVGMVFAGPCRVYANTIRIAICGPYSYVNSGLMDGDVSLIKQELERHGAAVDYVTQNTDISGYDGLVIPGGADIDPSSYGESDYACNTTNVQYDREQLAIIDKFVKAQKPILGICRGEELINVYFGGSLYQDISGHNGGVWHEVYTENNSTLGDVLGISYRVISWHHQAVKRVGDRLIITQKSSDGIAEAIEHTSLPIIGVQWHPEKMGNDIASELFEHFVNNMCRSSGSIFNDIDECKATAKYTIHWASQRGIVNGFSDGSFRPFDNCTRQQMIIILWRLAGYPEPDDTNSANIFSDADEFNQNSGIRAIAWGVEEGIIRGYADGESQYFDPEGTVTRAQTMIMMWRMAGMPEVYTTDTEFADISDQSEGVKRAICWGAQSLITAGDTNDGVLKFRPANPCQRQHITIFVYRFDLILN